MSKRANTSARGKNAAAPHEGWDDEDAERLAAGKPLYIAQARQERVRWNDGDWEVDPDVTGAVNYEEFFFLRLADAERWVGWQLVQWPAVVDANGDVMEATGAIDRVVFPPRDPEWPRQAMGWNYHSGFEGRMYGEPVAAEMEELAIRLAKTARSQGSSA
jgi:hypothetical protein